MIMWKRIVLLASLAASVAASAGGSTWAQPYPSKPLRLILPYTAGSPNDVIARLVAPSLSERLGQAVVVDNRAGGGTTVGLRAVMNAEPDGYTLLFSNTPTHVIAAAVAKGFSYDPVKDFVPIATFGASTLALVVPASLPVGSLPEFIAYAKAHPGTLNFGFGQGTLPHLVGDALLVMAGVDLGRIPYRGGTQAVTDMLGGRIQMLLSATATLMPLIRAGKLKALAVSSPQRHRDLPAVPTMAESGFPALTTVTYYGMLGPAGLPADIVGRLNRDANEILASPDLRASLLKVGFEPQAGSPQDFAALIAGQLQQWAPVVKATGFQME
ncbi:MAG TPA: tripartite tricarboxylate transporter substrate binding protein [Xanthobacteraceae bacterium]|jgi:tripartite-type tricarboxylate transporter receptor subunit TctC